MGKNHRHKKQLKSEKAKIKLKTSKTTFLPKGQNVTDISFKIRPITLSEQLRTKENETVSSRKLNLKEILNRLKHHNINMKYDNCQQLKELISAKDGEFLKQNLWIILPGICPLVLDKEQKVRKEAIKVINDILKLSTSANISFFYNRLSAYLRCAMTDIDQNVQEDSLLLLDAFIEHIPDLLSTDSHQILTYFFLLISKLKSGSKNVRTLMQNLSSKYTGVKWRIHALTRLEKILRAMHDYNLSKSNNNCIKETIIDASKTNYAPIYVDKYENYFTPTNCDSNSLEKMESYINTLMPLLNEAWLEVAPSNVSNITSDELSFTTLNRESASSLRCILRIIYNLYQLTNALVIENKSASHYKFKNKEGIGMFNAFLKSFPYSLMAESKQRKDQSNANDDSKCIKENLLICYLFGVQNKIIKEKKVIAHAGKILDYLNFYLLNGKYMEYQTNKFLTTIKIILETNIENWRQSSLPINEFIENVAHYYLHNSRIAEENEGTEILLMLHDVMDASSEKHDLIAEKSYSFLLRDTISRKLLDSLLLLVKRNVRAAQENVRKYLGRILENVTRIRVIGIEMEFMKIVHVLSLFHYVPLNAEDITILQKFGSDNPQYNCIVVSIIDEIR